MLVLKFGGASIGSERTLLNAITVVAQAARERPVVIVSAVEGVPDLLQRYAESPAERASVGGLVLERHRHLARMVEVDPAVLDPLLQAWQRQMRADAGKNVLSGAERDRVLSFGERLAAAMFAAGLKRAGVEATPMVAGDCGFTVEHDIGAGAPPETYAALRMNLESRTTVPVLAGFMARTPSGEITALGRHGTNLSAAVIAAALGARELQIWTHALGMLTADSRIVPEARAVPLLTFAESCELASFRPTLHPATLLPAIEQGIPVRILDTTQPDDPGTLITTPAHDVPQAGRVKSVACKKGITVVTVTSPRMVMASGFLGRVFKVFERHRIVVDLVTTSEASISMTVEDTSNLVGAVDELQALGRASVQPNRTLIAVIGEGTGSRVGLAGHLFTLLGGVGINVEMISQGASNVNLSCVVAERDADQAVRLLHRGLGLEATPPAPAPAPAPVRMTTG